MILMLLVSMSTALPACPSCQSDSVMRNGRTRHQKQNYKCRDCGRQFVQDPQWRMISEETKGILDRLLLEKLSLAGIARALQISELWLQQYVNAKYQQVEREVQVRPKPKCRLTIQMDELWSFVRDKGNKQWVWLAQDAQTREIVGVHIGDRSAHSAQALWQSLPPLYRQCAVVYSDFQSAYAQVLPSKRHRAVGKETGKTNYIVRASVAKQNGSTVRCDNGCRGSLEKPCHSPRS